MLTFGESKFTVNKSSSRVIFEKLIAPVSREVKQMKVGKEDSQSESRLSREFFQFFEFRAYVTYAPVRDEYDRIVLDPLTGKPVYGPYLGAWKKDGRVWNRSEILHWLKWRIGTQQAREQIKKIDNLQADLKADRDTFAGITSHGTVSPKEFVPFNGVTHTAKEALANKTSECTLFVNDHRQMFMVSYRVFSPVIVEKLALAGWYMKRMK